MDDPQHNNHPLNCTLCDSAPSRLFLSSHPLIPTKTQPNFLSILNSVRYRPLSQSETNGPSDEFGSEHQSFIFTVCNASQRRFYIWFSRTCILQHYHISVADSDPRDVCYTSVYDHTCSIASTSSCSSAVQHRWSWSGRRTTEEWRVAFGGNMSWRWTMRWYGWYFCLLRVSYIQ